MTAPQWSLATVVSDDFGENCYIAQLGGQADCLVIDPGLDPQSVVGHLERHGLVPRAILLTHGHIDHTAGTGMLKRLWPDCPLVIGAADAPKLTDPMQNLSGLFGYPVTCPPADRTVSDGEVYSAAGFDLRVLEIPGHSAGHVVYLWEAVRPQVAFVGDVLFAGSIGRTDFPDGDFEALAAGIRAKLYTLPDDTVLHSGHGPATTVGTEKRTNPFVRG